MSKDCSSQLFVAATTKTNRKANLPQVGESVFILPESSSNPLATRRALIDLLPSLTFPVETHFDDTNG